MHTTIRIRSVGGKPAQAKNIEPWLPNEIRRLDETWYVEMVATLTLLGVAKEAVMAAHATDDAQFEVFLRHWMNINLFDELQRVWAKAALRYQVMSEKMEDVVIRTFMGLWGLPRN